MKALISNRMVNRFVKVHRIPAKKIFTRLIVYFLYLAASDRVGGKSDKESPDE